MLQEIAKVIEWSNSDIKSLQYEAKKAPKQKEVELLGNYCGLSFRFVIEKLNQQRSILNELEENLNEKKRKFKYEIMLSDELNNLKKIEQNVDNP